MAQDSIYKGTKNLIRKINLADIKHNPLCSVTQEDIYFSTSYDLGPKRIVVPASPPVWIPHELPLTLPPDEPPIDPRTILPACPFDPLLRAASITCPELDFKGLDLISDRKNLHALLDFFNGKTKTHRIDAEIIGNTILLFLGWSGWKYSCTDASYGMNFQKHFTTPHSEGTIQHNRAVNYTIGGLKIMVKHQANARTAPTEPALTEPTKPETPSPASTTTPTGLEIIISGTQAPPETIIEIQTLLAGYSPTKQKIMAQLWFSRAPLLYSGYRDGKGHFSWVKEANVREKGLIDRWEGNNKERLQKLVRLIEMIREHMLSSPFKKQAIVLTKDNSGPVIRFYRLHGWYNIGLPKDLRTKWETK